MEVALKKGAGYNNAFTYGILSGATEAAMEKLGGYAFGDATSLLGKATAGTKFGAWASKGLGKAVTGAVSEGVEELGSDFADPVNKWITGVDTEIGANFREAVKNIPRTFAMGATVGSVMQGGQVLGQNMSNKAAGRGGAKATRADSSLAYVSESAQNYGKNEAQNRKTDKAILQGLTDIGVQMSDMTKEERAVYLESLGEYKNAFNEDGSIKQDLEIANLNNEAISRKLKPISATLKHAPISSNEQISEGASQAKAHIEKVLGSKANVVITNSDSGTNAFFNPDENVFYINNNSATLNDADGAIKKASLQVSFHEMTHSAEGTRQYNEFVNELYRVAMDENAPDAIKKRVGSLFDRELGAIQDYAEQTKGMSKAQARYTFDTEVTADLAGDILADDYIVNKLAERNAPLVKKLISRFKGTIKKSTTVDGESIRYLKKLVNRFEKALDNAQGGVKISQIGGDEDREDKVDDERKSFAGVKARTANKMTLENAEKMLEQGVDAETVRKETGWFKGYDGKWRFEIDDSKMDISTSGLYSRNIKVRRYAELVEKVYFEMTGTEAEEQELGKLMNEVEEITPKKIGDMVHHPELFKAYPELQNIDVVFLDNITGAAYNPGLNEIVISQQYKLNKIQLKETVIHELQHAVQTIEGFASGSSPEYWDEAKTKPTSEETNKIKSVENEFNQVRRKIIEQYGFEACGEFEKYFDYDRLYIEGDEADAEFAQSRMEELEERFKEKHLEDAFKDFSNAYMKLESTKQEIKFQKRKQSSYSLYMNTAGEIEARDSAKRKDLDAEQRKNTRPDIDRTDVVFAEDLTVSYVKANNDETSIRDQLRDKLDILNQLEPVANINCTLKSKLQAKTEAAEQFKMFGYHVDRQNFGVVEIGVKEIQGGFEYLNTPAEFAAIFAVPKVIKKGTIIDGHENHKGNEIETITIGAPVVINGKRGNMAVVVKLVQGNQTQKVKSKTKKYKTHRILMPDGSKFVFNETEKNIEPTGSDMRVKDNNQVPDIGSISNTIISEKSQKDNSFDKNNSKNVSDERKSVKRSYEVDSTGETLSEAQAEYFKDSKVRDKNGNLLVVYHGTMESFSVFDITKSRSYDEKLNYDLPGFYFSESNEESGGYGSAVKPYYVNVTNPYDGDTYKLAKEKGSYRKAYDYLVSQGYDGIIDTEMGEGFTEIIAFHPEQIKLTTNKKPTKNPDIRYSKQRSYEPGGESSKKITLGMSDAERTEILKDKKIQRIAEAQQFSQDVLEKIPEIHTWEDIDKYFGKQKRNLIQKIADEFKVFKNYENKDISLSFEFTNNNFRESYGKQKNKFVSFAKMFSVFDTVIENAVGIEVHKRPDYKPDPTLKNVYVLMSSFADGDYFIPVKLEIKEFNDKQNKLYVAIALDGIKKTEVSKQGTTEIGVAQGSRSVNISILDLMQKINPSNTNFTKYFPKNLLTQAQKEILDSDTNNDERKSVKRSYEPGKESEFEEKLAEEARQESFNQLMSEQFEEMQSLIKNRNESFEQLLSAKYDKVPVTADFENSEAISIDEADRDRLDSFNQQMSEKLEEVKAFDKERRELEAQLLKRNDNVPIAENLTQNEAASLESVERDRLESVKQLMNEKLEDFKNLEKQRKELEAQLLGKKENVPVTEEFENNEAASLDSVERERLDSFSQQMQEMLENTQSLLNNDASIVDAIIEQEKIYDSIVKMPSVRQIKGTEFAKGEVDLVTQVDNYFATYGNKVTNEHLGDVLIDRRGIKDDIAHGIGRKKAAAFVAVPDVIQKGKIVDYQKNWKGRGYDTAVIVAPVNVIENSQENRYFMGVVVIQNKENNRFYVHEVASIKKERRHATVQDQPC